jgi:DNA polymerase I-like protein with 3'-5' exonuclease and polymerase domains
MSDTTLQVDGIPVIRDPRRVCELLQGDRVIGFDTETTGLSPWRDNIALIQLYGEQTSTLGIIQIANGVVPECVVDLFRSKDRLFVVHNGVGFDLLFLHTHGIPWRETTWFDTLVGESVLAVTGRRDVSKSLKASMKRRLGKSIDKDVEHGHWADKDLTDQQVLYASQDVISLPALYHAQMDKAESSKQTEAMLMEQRLMPVVAQMEINGLPCVESRVIQFVEDQKVEIAASELYLRNELGEINLNSPIQLKNALISRGINVTGTGAEIMQPIAMFAGGLAGEIATNVLKWKHGAQRIKMYGEDWRRKSIVNDWVHPHYWQCVSKDTLVEMPRDLARYPKGIPINQVKIGDLVYSFGEDKKLSLNKVLNVGCTGRKLVYTVSAVSSDGQDTTELKLTADHKIRMVDGSWKTTIDLVPGDKILCMPKRRSMGAGYFALSNRRKETIRVLDHWEREHVWIAQQVFGELPDGFNVHHKDLNSYNNEVTNLEVMTAGAHSALHSGLNNYPAARLSEARAVSKDHVESVVFGNEQLVLAPDNYRKLAKKFGLQIEDDKAVDTETGRIRDRKATGKPMFGQNHVVTSVIAGEVEEVWDMTVEHTHCFIANDIAVHNCGADTTRFTCSDPNLQQIPKDSRGKLIGGIEGFEIVSADYSQIEVRIAAHYANDQILIAALEGEDIHRAVAANVYGVSEEEVTKEQRRSAKAMTFLLLFGGGPARYYDYVRMQGSLLTYDDSVKAVNKFFTVFEGLRMMKDKAQRLAATPGPTFIKLPNSARRMLVGASKRMTVILNTMVQGSASVGIKHGMLVAEDRGLGQFLGGQVHDELVAAVPTKMHKEYGEELKEAMIVGMHKVLPLTVKVEVSHGNVWQA